MCAMRAIMMVGAHPGGGGAPLGYYKSLTHNHLKLGSTDLTDYPVLISITDADLKDVAHGGKVNRSDGLDVWASTTSGGVTKVPYEARKYDNVAGTWQGWVKASSRSHTADGIFGYLRFGDTSITTDQSDLPGTFSALRAVYHTTYGTNSTAVSAKDATGNHDALLSNTPTSATGKIYQSMNVGGLGFPHPYLNFDSVVGGVLPTTTGNYTYSYWWKAASSPGSSSTLSVIEMNKSGSDALGMNWSHSNATSRQAAYQANSAGTYFAAKIATTVTGGVWYLITVEWDGTNLKIYLNGSLEASTGVTSILNNPGAIAGALGQWQGNAEAGVVEESRFATSALGASWALADYNSQNDPATFVTFGATTPV